MSTLYSGWSYRTIAPLRCSNCSYICLLTSYQVFSPGSTSILQIKRMSICLNTNWECWLHTLMVNQQIKEKSNCWFFVKCLKYLIEPTSYKFKTLVQLVTCITPKNDPLHLQSSWQPKSIIIHVFVGDTWRQELNIVLNT